METDSNDNTIAVVFQIGTSELLVSDCIRYFQVPASNEVHVSFHLIKILVQQEVSDQLHAALMTLQNMPGQIEDHTLSGQGWGPILFVLNRKVIFKKPHLSDVVLARVKYNDHGNWEHLEEPSDLRQDI